MRTAGVRPGSHQGGAAGRIPDGQLHRRPLYQRQLVRTRSVGPVRHPLRRPSELAADSAAALLGRPSGPQGLSGARHRVRPLPAHRRAPGRGTGGARIQTRRMGHEARHRGGGLHVLEPGSQSSLLARRVPHHPAARRRGNTRRGIGDRLPPPRRRKNGRTPVVAQLHSLYRPHRLSGRRDEQPAVCAGGGEARRHRGAGSGQDHPRDDGGILPHHLASAVSGYLHPGRGCDDADIFHVCGSAESLRRDRGRHRIPHASGLVSHRRCGARSAARLG